jgi:hypothetical protein
MQWIQRQGRRGGGAAGRVRQILEGRGGRRGVQVRGVCHVRRSCSSVHEVVRFWPELVEAIAKPGSGHSVTFDPLWATTVRVYEW